MVPIMGKAPKKFACRRKTDLFGSVDTVECGRDIDLSIVARKFSTGALAALEKFDDRFIVPRPSDM
jgi:hypothetical protein